VSIDAQAVQRLYERYGPMVLRRCRHLLRDEHEGLDAMQEVFSRLLCRGDALSAAAPSSLLYRVATNVCLNRLRTRRRHPEHTDDATLRQLEQIADAADPERASFVRRLLDRVFVAEESSTQTMAVMHWVDGMTLEDVAAEVGLSVSGVRKRLRTLRSRAVAMSATLEAV
jgi:RNA polymerase sigma-70 factor (ECF subfamily)